MFFSTQVGFLSNPGKLHSETLVQLLRYIMYKKNLGLKYYTKTEDVPLSDLLRKARIKSDNQLMVFSYFIWKDCLDTGRGTRACIVFYKG